MTREEKHKKRIERSKYRKRKRMDKYVRKIQESRRKCIPHYVSLSGAKYGSWPDSNSPTGYSQVCDYIGICQSPCNGDC